MSAEATFTTSAAIITTLVRLHCDVHRSFEMFRGDSCTHGSRVA